MTSPSILRTTALLAVFLVPMASASAQDGSLEARNSSAGKASPSGIRTDRLSPRRLRLWQSVTAIVLATDEAGSPLHPRLYSLWQAVAASGHVVYIELPEQKGNVRVKAGEFVAETTDPDGRAHAAVIRLYPWAIDRAKSAPGEDGFEPFRGLGREERYAEVLGHELAHAVRTFSDLDYAQKAQELDREASGYPEFCRPRSKSPQYAEELRLRASRIETLGKALEKPAYAVEIEVWRELLLDRGGSHRTADRAVELRVRLYQGSDETGRR